MSKRIRIEKKYVCYSEVWLDEEDTQTVLNYMEENNLGKCYMDAAVEECLGEDLITINPWDWDEIYGAELEEISYAALEEYTEDEE